MKLAKCIVKIVYCCLDKYFEDKRKEKTKSEKGRLIPRWDKDETLTIFRFTKIDIYLY